MAESSKLQVLIDLQVKNQKAIDNLESKLGSLDANGKAVGAGLTSSFIKGGLAVKAVEFAVRGLTSMLRGSIAESNEMTQSYVALAQSMANMGFGQKAYDDMVKFTKTFDNFGIVSSEAMANALKDTAMYEISAESMKKMAYMIADLDVSENGLNSTYGTVYNTAKALNKALNGQFDILTRQGFAIDDAHKKLIQYGNEEERISALSDVVGYYVGGMNEALGMTDAGKIIRLQTAFGDLKASIGQLLQGVLGAMAGVLTTIVNALTVAVYYLRAFLQMLGIVGKASVNVTAGGVGGFDDTADSIDGANSSAKDFARTLQGFDKMNVIASKDKSKGGGGSGVGVDPNDTGKITALADGLTEQLQKTFGNFISWFKDTFPKLSESTKQVFSAIQTQAGVSAVQIANSWTNLVSSLSSIWSNLGSSLTSVFDSLSALFVTFVGYGIVAGMQIGTAIITGILDTLSAVSELLIAVFTPAIESLNSFLTSNFEVIKATLITFWQSIGTTISETFSIAFETIIGVINGFGEWFEEKRVELEGSWTLFWEAIWSILSFKLEMIRGWVTSIFGGISDFLKANQDSIKNTIVSVWDAIWSFIKPIVNGIADFITYAWKLIEGDTNSTFAQVRSTISSVLTDIWSVFSMIISNIVTLWNNFRPIWDVAWPLMWASVKATFTTIWNVIVGVFSGALDIIKGVFEVFSGILTGNWTKVWTGLKDILKGIINSILSMVEGLANGVIDAINGIIRSINSVSSKSGIHFSEVPRLTIPKLAEGGIITGPTLALIGEAGDEAVVPLDQYNNRGSQTIIVKIGEDTIAEKVIEAINNRSSQMGYNLLTV
ncbi:MAG: hypothetical protein PHE32_03950 [Candidatus Shapirobacteria bacterium]|nr:hypothetical protein [Candidatus Shapirobacteria bacterium]